MNILFINDLTLSHFARPEGSKDKKVRKKRYQTAYDPADYVKDYRNYKDDIRREDRKYREKQSKSNNYNVTLKPKFKLNDIVTPIGVIGLGGVGKVVITKNRIDKVKKYIKNIDWQKVKSNNKLKTLGGVTALGGLTYGGIKTYNHFKNKKTMEKK